MTHINIIRFLFGIRHYHVNRSVFKNKIFLESNWLRQNLVDFLEFGGKKSYTVCRMCLWYGVDPDTPILFSWRPILAEINQIFLHFLYQSISKGQKKKPFVNLKITSGTRHYHRHLSHSVFLNEVVSSWSIQSLAIQLIFVFD